MHLTMDQQRASGSQQGLVQLEQQDAGAAEQRRLQMQSARTMQPLAAEQSFGLLMPHAEVSRVSMRMPEFTPTDPQLWFSIVDRSFQAAGITVDATKFGYALMAIGPRYTVEVRDIIMNRLRSTRTKRSRRS